MHLQGEELNCITLQDLTGITLHRPRDALCCPVQGGAVMCYNVRAWMMV